MLCSCFGVVVGGGGGGVGVGVGVDRFHVGVCVELVLYYCIFCYFLVFDKTHTREL